MVLQCVQYSSNWPYWLSAVATTRRAFVSRWRASLDWRGGITASTTVRFLSTPDRSANPAQHHRRPIITCDCRTCMEQSSYQHHIIKLFAIFQETTYNIFIYQILPISLIFLFVICVPCPRSYCSLCHVNLYVLLLLLLLHHEDRLRL